MPYAGALTHLMFLSAFIGLLVSVILAYVNTVQRHANRLLSLSLFSVAFFALNSALLINHSIFVVPHLFRLSMPLQYLVAPCAYLYVRSVLYQETRFHRSDWLHFVPFGLHTVELLPFLLHSSTYKLQYLHQIMADIPSVVKQQEGLLPGYYHPVLKFILGTGYVLLQWRLLWQFRPSVPGLDHQQNNPLMRWLLTFTGLNTLLYPPVLVVMVLPWGSTYATIFTVSALGSYLLLASVLLFFQPQILYGLWETPTPVPTAPAALEAATKEEPAKVYSLTSEKKQQYRTCIEAHMQQDQPYLQKGYGIKDLAAETSIPSHHLSALINQEYQMNFSDFINRYRVEYIKERMTQLDWRQLTLEGIAMEGGFSNRTTFFRAFVKLNGITPSEYLTRYTPS